MKTKNEIPKNQDAERKTDTDSRSVEADCCCSGGMAEAMAKCCADAEEEGSEGRQNVMSMCSGGMKFFRWLPSFPVVLGVFAFLLGYFLNPDGIWILWLILSGTVTAVGLAGFILMSTRFKAWD